MANDFDEAAAERRALRYAFDESYFSGHFEPSDYKDDPSVEPFIQGAKWQHSLMQERLAELAAELARVPGEIQMYRQKFESMVSSHDHAQLSATCERYRNALEQCYNLQDTDYVETTDEHGDEKELWVNSNELRHICEEALESGEREE